MNMCNGYIPWYIWYTLNIYVIFIYTMVHILWCIYIYTWYVYYGACICKAQPNIHQEDNH